VKVREEVMFNDIVGGVQIGASLYEELRDRNSPFANGKVQRSITVLRITQCYTVQQKIYCSY
jgi:hypothetical protein